MDNVEFESTNRNALAFSQIMEEKKKAARSTPSDGSPNYSEASDIIKSDDNWSPGSSNSAGSLKKQFLLAKKPKRSPPSPHKSSDPNEAITQRVQNRTAVRGSDFVRGVDEFTVDEAESIVNTFEEKNLRPSVDELTVDEAESIANAFEDKRETKVKESAEDIAAEADDIMSGFSGSKKSSISSREFSSGSSDPAEYSLGMEEEVMMHTIGSDVEGDIGLDELFETAAALDVTLETEQTAKAGQPILDDEDSMGFESNSSASFGIIHEEQEETTTDEESAREEPILPPKPTPAVASYLASIPRSFAHYLPSENPLNVTTLYSANRVMLYESDDEEEARTESTDGTPMPWFAAVPYSTGKWKQTEDGMSVTSDDVWHSPPKPILGAGHQLSYKHPNRNYKPTNLSGRKDPRRMSRRTKIIVIVLAVLLVVIIAAVLVGLFVSASSVASVAVAAAESTASPTISPTALINEEIVEDIEEDTEFIDNIFVDTEAPSTKSPTGAPTGTQTLPLDPKTEFNPVSIATGDARGDRLGSIVSMTSDGSLLAALSRKSGVETFAHDGTDWILLPILPSDTTDVEGLDTAISAQDGSPVVVLSSATTIESYQLVDGAWIPYGAIIERDPELSISETSMALSADASTLAFGRVDAYGTTSSVTIYSFDKDAWKPMEIDLSGSKEAYTRAVKPEEGTILGIFVTLSGDGSVLTMAEWNIGSPQIVLQSYSSDKGKPLGSPIDFPHGPVSVSLSDSGHRLAVVDRAAGSVYEYDGSEWLPIGGNAKHGFLPGGSSVAMSGNGKRILIGDVGLSKVSVYDYADETEYFYTTENWSAWLPTIKLFGPEDSGFGASVSMDSSGSVLGVGAPLRSPTGGQEHAGLVTIYA
jgi:hypothetical protein